MRNQVEKKRKPFMILVYWVMIMTLFSLLVTATYTWFSISRTPKVGNMGLHVNAPAGLSLSTEPEGAEWVQQVNVADLIGETTPLRPVTWSETDQCFYAVVYGIDGRQTGQYIKLSDNTNANRNDIYGYYIKFTLYATSEADVKVKLTEAMELNDGRDGAGTYLIGSPIWDSEQILHSDGGNGAQNAIRVGFKFTPLVDGDEQSTESQFFIYEPNSDTHLSGEQGYVDTPSIDGSPTLVSSDKLISQTSTTWTEADVVERSVVVKEMGDFLTDTNLISIKAQEVFKIDIYLWLEGQDIDCKDLGTKETQIMANIQFYADTEGQSGMQPITDDID